MLHFSGRYWTDYGCDPHGPMSWRFKGPAGSGALADVGSHMAYVSEFLCGDMTSVSGGQLSTVINERPLPLGAVMGHDHAEVSDVFEPSPTTTTPRSPRPSRTARVPSRCPGSPPVTPTA